MSKYFYFYQIARRPLYLLLFYLLAYLFDLSQTQLAAHHHRICKHRVEAYGFYISNIYLGRNMHLHPYLPCIGNYSLIHSDYRCKPSFFSGIKQRFNDRKVVIVNNSIEGEVSANTLRSTTACYLIKVSNSKVDARPCPHIQLVYPKIY